MDVLQHRARPGRVAALARRPVVVQRLDRGRDHRDRRRAATGSIVRAQVAAAVLRLPARRAAVLVSNQQQALLTHRAATAPSRPTPTCRGVSPFGANDIVVDGRGNAYVNSPNFEFGAGPPDGAVQPGLVALVTPDGAVRVVADDIAFPNGMAVTADNRTLVVADSYRHQLVGFDIDADGDAVRPAGLGRPRRRRARRHLPRRRRRRLVRRRAAPALRAGGRGRRGARHASRSTAAASPACSAAATRPTSTSSPRAGPAPRRWPPPPTGRARCCAPRPRSPARGGPADARTPSTATPSSTRGDFDSLRMTTTTIGHTR